MSVTWNDEKDRTPDDLVPAWIWAALVVVTLVVVAFQTGRMYGQNEYERELCKHDLSRYLEACARP